MKKKIEWKYESKKHLDVENHNIPIVFDCVDHNQLCKILKELWTPDQLTCLLRSLYAGQEATVRIGHGKKLTGSKLGKE